MNKCFRGVITGAVGLIKSFSLKQLHFNTVHIALPTFISPLSEITVEKKAKLIIGRKFRMRSGSRLRVRKNAELIIGNNIALNQGVIITCKSKIEIGDNVQFGPNVLIYDHDHDYDDYNGINTGTFKYGNVKIGNNVWIGAGTIILRGSEIGDNCVIAAGSVIKGKIESNIVVYQKRNTVTKKYEFRKNNRL